MLLSDRNRARVKCKPDSGQNPVSQAGDSGRHCSMRIQVTSEDLANGRRRDARGCPVALALNRAGILHFGVTGMLVWFAEGQRCVLLPTAVQEWIRAYDAGVAMEPIEFELSMNVDAIPATATEKPKPAAEKIPIAAPRPSLPEGVNIVLATPWPAVPDEAVLIAPRPSCKQGHLNHRHSRARRGRRGPNSRCEMAFSA